MSTINAAKTLKQSADGKSLSANGVLFDGNTAFNATAYSEPFWIKNVDTVAIQVSCPATGTPNGSFAIQGCNDASQLESLGNPDTNLVNWSTLSVWDEATGAWVQSKAVAGAQSYMVTMPGSMSRWIRFVWTNTSGSANLIVKVQAKGDGGR